ncbi:(Fe-S)-binding protein [Sporomusa acidovorans]|uniref:Glycolate oxidase iron-sulfur subunit n=1 Tax=Sporomusa acidovorans (strain ATCC 49682 / DSM 3132 / Mol) TaxID=1123286 RepID=A0ABZ3IXX8_SPOA4|nr:(Fe-S)-binding protein [Sporomusa acidovorans]OZC13043.1 lactate utilization protein A [Sporomusa acidovorans DSM 3132]SDF51311.1 glycolate oxidase iron-sulfur subunit [Sporomusa acidovorans]
MKKSNDAKLLEQAGRKVSQCQRCGTCLTVCPLYAIDDVEKVSPRGKSMLARGLDQGGVEPTEEVLRAVDFCLLCGACSANCPNKVRTDDTVIDVREYLMQQNGGPGLKYKTMGNMLKSRGMVSLATGAMKVLRGLGLGGIVPNGMLPDQYTREQFLAAFAGPRVFGQAAEPSKLKISKEMQVAYFKGCTMKMIFPEVVKDTLKILEGITTPLVMENVCCGLPHLAHGLRNEFLELAKKNIELYAEADIVVTDCASCGSTLKHMVEYFADDPHWQSRAAAFSRKVIDITEYLVGVGYSPRQKLTATLTYHDPCHLVRGQGIKKQPRQLLQAAGNFVDMKAADTCCGGAGSFHMDYPEVSTRILANKQRNIEQTGADVVVTGCPVCLIQLNKAAKSSGGKFKAMHICQVI